MSSTSNAAGQGLVISCAATAVQLTALALIGSGMPDPLYRQPVLATSLPFALGKNMGLRLQLHHEIGMIRD